jgi:CheY-like chemotaxis protein
VLIAVTGYGQAEDLRRSTEAGFDAHLVKPVSQSRLSTLITGT